MHLMRPAPETWQGVHRAVAPVAEEVRDHVAEERARDDTQRAEVKQRSVAERAREERGHDAVDDAREDEKQPALQEPTAHLGQRPSGEESLQNEHQREHDGWGETEQKFHGEYLARKA